MSDHDFEKQVRQKLSGLNITPSSEAWVNIEEKLRQRRRRRAPFIWLPLLLSGLLAGGYVLLHQGTGHPETSRMTVATTDADHQHAATMPASPADGSTPASSPAQGSTIQPDTASAFNHSPIDNTVTPQLSGNQPDATTKDVATTGGRLPRKSPLSPKVLQEQIRSKDGGKEVKNDDLVQQRKRKPGLDANAAQIPTPQAPKRDIAGSEKKDSEDLSGDSGAPGVPLAPSTANASKPTLRAPATRALKTLSAAVEDSTAVIAAKPVSAKKKISRWSFALNASSGVVAVNEGGLADMTEPNVEDVSYTPSFAGVAPSYAPPNYTPPLKPSTISPGLAFSVGGLVKRELSNRLSLSAGLNYTQFNTRSNVGDRVNSSQVVNNGIRGYLYVQSYYRLDPVENKEYKNRYHFIEVPVTLHARINRSERLPIYVNGGLIVSRLISSTSLHFDGTTGVYYKNDRLLNQTQVGVGAGVSFALFNKTSHPLWIGPAARSNISTILKKDVSASKHFVSLGLDLKWFLKK